MNYSVILFDLDGTTLDTLGDLKNSANYALRVLGYPEKTLEEVRAFVGNGVGRLMRLSLPENTNEEIWLKSVELQKEYYQTHLTVETIPYKGVRPLLEQLREEGYKLAMVSNKYDAAVQELAYAFFPGLFDCVIGEKEGRPKKPDPAMVYAAIADLNNSTGGVPESLIYVGDSEVDYRTASNSGAVPILVDWGFRDRKVLEGLGAPYIVSSMPELHGLIHRVSSLVRSL